MGSSITVRDIDPGDKAWLRREARRMGVSMEEFVRRLIRKKRTKTERRPKPSHGISDPSMGSICRPQYVTAIGQWSAHVKIERERPAQMADRFKRFL